MEIRYSRESDYKQIKKLINTCFGDRSNYGVLDNLDGRYLCYLDDKEVIVGITGLSSNTKYPNGMEVDWTCVKPSMRGKGVMDELFKVLITLTDGNIYCSCWKWRFKDKINLHRIMQKFKFECICEAHIQCNLHKCGMSSTKGCKGYTPDCKCQEDLYIRRAIKQ